MSFTTDATPSVNVTTGNFSIDGTNVTLQGSVDDISSISEYGFMYGTSPDDVTVSETAALSATDFSVELNLSPNTIYFYKAYAMYEGNYIYGNAEYFQTPGIVTSSQQITGSHNGYSYVDLGLPSGTMWAITNVGATNPEDYGDYYAWAETEAKETYGTNYRYLDLTDGAKFTKYCTDENYAYNGSIDGLTVLEAIDDAATANWGEGWKTPTLAEMQELVDNCSWEWAIKNGIYGWLLTGSNENTIFLPFGGVRYENEPPTTEESGVYWTSSLRTEYMFMAWGFSFVEDGYDTNAELSRMYGLSVRPVYAPSNTASNETGTFIDDRDGRTYDYVVIGDQTWMAENLRYDNSGSMTVALSGEQSTTDQYLYYPNGLSENLETYGYLYNWPAAMNGESSSDANPSGVQGICPNGWHLPSDAEWSQLEDALGGTDNAGAMLAGNAELWVSGDLTESEHFGTSGFLALPAGRYDGSFGFLGTDAYFWSATERSSNYVYYRDIYNDYTNMNRDSNSKDYSYSIRCVKNEGNTASNSTGSHNGHEYVDLGLSVKWATVNIGAEAPDEEGNLYAWGEKETKSIYDWINYEHCEGYSDMINKYFTNEGIGVTDPDDLTTLLPEDDAVTVNWGAGWRMPTSVEVEELINNCTIEGSTISGNGNSITMNSVSYWTSSLYLDNQNKAYIFDNSNGGALSNDERSSGYPVRGVYDATLALPTVITDSLSNLGATSVYLYGTVIEEEGVPTATDFGFKYGTDSQSLTETIQGDPGTVGFTATLTELQPGTTYFCRAYATNENGTGYGEIKTFTTPSGEYGGHAYIDLGLSSGTLWATCNVGADRPEGYGNYYAWGETTPKDEYTWSTYQHANGTTDDDPKLTKYCNDAGYGDGGFVDNLTTLELEDDAASVNWGTGWRMPTREEIKELVDSCIWAWEEPNGIAGYRVTSRNGNSIFLPASGLHYADAFISEGSSANYWSNTLEQGALPIEVSNIAMFTNSYNVSGVYRYLGYSVRAIFQKSPTVITNSATEISTTTANLQGKIVSSGISDVTARGFIYGTDSENLTDSIASTDNTDEFSVSLSNLESGKRYYFKAFAANDDGVSYGSVRSFRTLGPPSVTVYYPEWRDTTSVSLKASVEAGGEISSNKFYIGTDRSSLSEVSGEVNFSNNDSTYTLNVYDLLPETLYWVTAESEDNYGSRRGDTISFYTYGHFVDARDDTDYRTIQIGDQIWMAENLRFATDIQVGADTSSTVAYRYYPAGDEANTSTYGYLYNWKATMNGANSSEANPSGVQGICPDGWHLPSNSEWEQLENFLGSEKAASKLAGSASLWFSNYGPCLMLTDSQFASSGFNAVPSGVYYTQYYVFGQEVAFWSATKYDETNVYTRYFYATRTDLVTSDNEPVNGYSVRCVKSAPTVATNSATNVTPTSATLIGSISNAASSGITARGFMFGTDSTSLTQNLQSTDNTADFTYTLSDLTANTTYYFKAYATVNGETMYGEVKAFMTPSGVHDNYAYVDLGLPSGTMWATINIGAESFTEAGNRYAWGETTTKDEYTQSNYTYSDNPTILPAEADAAAVNWQGDWRMPTYEEMLELKNNCTATWIQDIEDGMVFTGPNGNSIFLHIFTDGNGTGYYWSSSIDTDDSSKARGMSVYASTSINNVGMTNASRYYGDYIRPVYRLVPTVATLSATNVAATSAVLHGRISNIGNSEVTARGFKFGTSSDNLTETLTSTDNTDEFSYTLSDLEAGRTYYFRAFATNSDGTSYDEVKILMTPSGQQLAGHDYVDLGLPSGIMWATCNVGATSPEEEGNSYAWGETTIKDTYSQDNYTYSDNPERLPADHDAAAVVWGGGWHTPTSTDFEELVNNCTLERTTLNDVEGYVFTGPNGNSIFMRNSYYWSSSLVITTQTNAYSLSLNTTGANVRSSTRTYGDYVRGVYSVPEVALSYPVWRDSVAVSLKAKYAVNGVIQSSKYYVGTAKNNLSEVTEGVTLNGDEHLLTVNVYDLEPRTQYWAMAEIVDEYGTFRSDTLSFYTYGSFVDFRDNTTYYTIQIGEQTWMAENLKYAGDIPVGTDTSYTVAYRYYPGNDEANVETYGYLYNWQAAMNGEESSDMVPSGVQGICPNGWHFPSEDEWILLTTYFGETAPCAQFAGRADLWQSETFVSTQYFGMSGFGASPAGIYYDGDYRAMGDVATFWNATKCSYRVARNYSVNYGSEISEMGWCDDKYNSFSVRCVKGTTIYAYDTVSYCGDQYTFGTQTLTASGDYEETFTLGTDKDSVVYLHLTMNPAPTASISASTIHCSGQTATLTNTASGGTAPYTYNWTADAGITLGETSVTTTETSYNNTATPTFSECSASFSVNLSVTDANGCTANATSVTINVEREDFTMPANGNSTVACIDQATEPTPPTVNDNCGNTLTPSAAAQGGTYNGCSGTRTYTFTYTDCEGNEHDWTYTYTIERNDFDMPYDDGTTVACASVITAPTLPTVIDNCGNALTGTLKSGYPTTTPSCEGDVVYKYTFTDCAGNSHDWTYTYTIAPVDFTMPADGSSTVACATEITAPTLPAVTDNCGNVLTGTLKSGYPTETPSCNGDVVYKYTFTDCAGHNHDWTYTYTIERNVAPALSGTWPENISGQNACYADRDISGLLSDDGAKALYTANCGTISVSHSDVEVSTDNCGWTVTRTYIISDGCNDITKTQSVSGSDQTAPELTGTWPADITGQNACMSDASVSGLAGDDDIAALYTDCANITVTHTDADATGDNCSWTIVRTFTISDGCNDITKTQSVSGGDQTAPTIGDASLSRELTSTNCTFIVPDLTEEVRAISSDNCSANADLTITQIPVAGTEITDEIVVTVTITVTDQCGLSSTKDVTLTIPEELTTSLTAGTIACNGGTTDITNEVAGGTSPYTYYWTDDTHNQNNEGVGAGNYTVTVTDNNGCSATSSIAVTQPNALTATLSATEINCHGQTSDISNTVAGGTEPYTYLWNNDATTQDLEGVGGGTYSVTVTDSNACTATASVTVNEPAELTSELTAGTATCNGGTADIENTVSGGTEPITYAWSNNSNTQNLTGVVAGEYSVTVTDAKGCSVVKTTEITQPDVLAVTLNAGTIACNGETTTVSTEVAGGTQPYTYAWNNDATTENLTDAVAGTYSVTVTDANTCSTTAVTTITEPSELTVTISGPTSVCENTTTTLTANAQGGTTDYTYLWNTTATASFITTPEISTETPYSVTVTDANGCTASEGVTVVVGDTPGITISDVTAICAGGTTILQANVSNAGTDYTVEWSSPDTGAGLPDILTTDAITVTPTEAGTYTYIVSLTATSCSDGQPFNSSENVTLTVIPLPDVTIVNNADTTVITCNTTQIELTATGGTLYQWSNGATTATTSITAPETYIVTVTDANGCTNTESITLTQDVEAPIVTITNTTGTELLTCTTTEINVEADGTGTSYLWSNDATTASNTFTEGGTYTVTATADNGCTSTANIQITPNSDAPTLSITNNTGETILTCSLTSIIVTAEGSGASYEWSNGARTAETTLTEAGTYTVTTTATNGCTASTQITITANLEEPEIIATATDSTICQGSSTTLTASGGSSYTWSPETGLPSTVGATLTASPTTTTTYTVTGIGTNGCAGSGEVVITVNLPTESEITQIACESYEWNGTTYTETGDFTQTFTNANGCDSVVTLHLTINNAVTNEISDSACESYEWYGQTYTASGDYEHTLTAANGCDSVVTLHLTINQPTESNDTVSACGSYEWYGQTYTETGDYVHTLQSVNGCDSVVNLHLTINQPTEGNDTVIACDNYEWFGQTYTETGDYVHTLQSANGCDSIVNLHLTINSSTTGEFADQMCSGVPYEYEGHTYNEAGTYYVTLVNASGCDSVVTLTLTYSNSCGGIISGVITDAGTDEAIPNARVTIGNQVIRTNNNGEYSLEVVRGLVSLRVSAEEYVSYYEAIDIHSDTMVNVALYKPEISMDVDSISVTTYPYLAQYDSITITNTGNTALVWSSVSDYDSLALLPYDEEAHQRRNSRSLWDSIQTFTTQFNAEQAIATDGFFIYTSSWMRPGEFNRYTPDGEYIETFYIENVGMIRNLSFDGTYFYGTEATNIIFKLDLDNQMLVDSITTDISNIRHCSFDRQNGTLLAGSWNTLYSIDTATGVSTQIRSDLMNVYSSAYDNLSPGGPYLWLFSQASQNNGPSAYIRQFSIGNADYTNKTHYLDDIGLGNASLAGGICASEYVREGKFVLLADVQNPSGNNVIATYEIGRTNNIVSPEKKSGRIMPNESLSIGVREHAVGEGEYEAKIRYRAAVMGNRTKDVNVTVTAVAPECDAVQQIIAVTDTFYNVTLNWQPIELGEYRSVSYLIYGDNSQFALDTTTETSITFERLSVGEHCFNVRALSVGDYSCLSESSDTVCAEIEPIPCNVALAVSASNDGESIFLTWNKPVGVEYFRIYRDDNAVEEVLYDGRYTDSNVVPEVTYCYTIFAYFEDGICNEIVGTACTKIVSGVCAESPVLQIEAVGYSVHLNWTVTSDSYTYKIFRNDVAIGMTTDTTYFDNVNPGYNYCYKVESLCEYGMFAYSNEECVFVEIIPEDDDENGQGSGEGDAIAEWTADNLTVYPNPTYGQFFIEGQRIATVIIYNASGQIVAELDNNESDRIMVDCDGWNPGLYNIRIISVDGQVATRKVSIFR